MAERSRTWVILGVGVIGIAVGVGVGALIWSGDSGTTRTVAVAPQSNEAPADDPNAPDINVVPINVPVRVQGLHVRQARVVATVGTPTHCVDQQKTGTVDLFNGERLLLFARAGWLPGTDCAKTGGIETTWSIEASEGPDKVIGKGKLHVTLSRNRKGNWSRNGECVGWQDWSCQVTRQGDFGVDPEFTLSPPA
jgi:hypothetical protein